MKVTAGITGQGGIPIGVDSKALVEVVVGDLREFTSATIRASVDPETGSSKPDLSARAQREPRKGGRGYRTGRLANLDERTTGGFFASTGRVMVPGSRAAFIHAEAIRGVKYLSLDGDAAKALDDSLDRHLEEAIKEGDA